MERDVLPRWGDRPLAKIQRRDIKKLLDLKADNSPVMPSDCREQAHQTLT